VVLEVSAIADLIARIYSFLIVAFKTRTHVKNKKGTNLNIYFSGKKSNH